MTVVLKSSTYSLTLKRCGEMSPGPAMSLRISSLVSVSVIARSVFGLPQPGPHEVTGRDDADRGGLPVCYDEAVDAARLHCPGRLFESGSRGNGESRLCHDLPDRE